MYAGEQSRNPATRPSSSRGSALRSILFCAFAAVTSLAHAAIDTVDGIDWWFVVENGKATVKSTMDTQLSAISPDTAGAIVVPETLGGYPVVAIGASAFSGCSKLTSVKIPRGVTAIGNYAFNACRGLTSIEIPEGVDSVGERAFSSCSGLSSVVFSGEVGTIGSSAFSGCSGLASVTFSGKVGSIDGSAFYACSALEVVEIPDGVATIGSSAFASCTRLKSVRISGGVGSVGSYAFSPCLNLTSVRISDGVGSIGSSAFSSCTRLTSVWLSGVVGTLGNNSFYGCSALTNFVFAGTVGSIGGYAFGNCSSLEGIDLPSSVTNVSEGAFYNCGAMRTFTFPKSVAHIADSVLAGCVNLVSLNIEKGVSSIGLGAFLNCRSLREFTLPEGIAQIENNSFLKSGFWDDQPDDALIVKDGYVLGFKGNVQSRLTIPEGVTAVSANMFRDYTNVTEVVFPATMKKIGDYAFYNTGLESVAFPESLEQIGRGAFADSAKLGSFTGKVTGIAHDETLFDGTEVPAVQVAFDAAGGTLDSAERNLRYAIGLNYGRLPEPTRANFRFLGWLTKAEEGDQVKTDMIAEPAVTNLVASWEKHHPYTIAFDPNGGTGTVTNQACVYNEPVNLLANSFSRPGFRFCGWAESATGEPRYPDGALVSNLSETANGRKYLYAAWKEIRSETDVEMPTGETKRTDISVSLASNVCVFSGMLLPGETHSFTFTNLVAGTYRFAIDPAAGPRVAVNASLGDRTVTDLSSAEVLVTLTNRTYVLKVSGLTGSVTNYPYQASLNRFGANMTLDVNGGLFDDGVNPYGTAFNLTSGTPIGFLPEPTNGTEGVFFEGWYDATGSRVAVTDPVGDGSLSLTARWSDPPVYAYTVVFDANGGSGSMPAQTFVSTEKARLSTNAFTRAGYVLKGWATDPNGAVVYTDHQEITSPIVMKSQSGTPLRLYARWMTSDGIEEVRVDGLTWRFRVTDGQAEVCGAGQAASAAKIVIPSVLCGADVTAIGTNAFAGCTQLTDVEIPLAVTSIGDEAFAGCSSLESVLIPENVVSLGDRVFADCSRLHKVYFLGNRPEVGADIYVGTMEGLISYVLRTRQGWTADDDSEDETATNMKARLPKKWPEGTNARFLSWYASIPGKTLVKLTFYHYNGTTDFTAYQMLANEGRVLESLPDEPEREGYEFVGWFTEPYGGDEVEAPLEIVESADYYAHWLLNREDYEDPLDWDEIVYRPTSASVYDGYLMDGDVMAGTVKFKFAKGRYSAEDACTNVSVSASVTLLGEGKKRTLKGVCEDVTEDGGSGELTLPRDEDRTLSLEFDAQTLTGDFDGYTIVANRNIFGSAIDMERRVALAALDDARGDRIAVFKTSGDSPLANGYAVVSVKIGAKGRTKVKAMLPDGKQLSTTTQLQIGEEAYELPVVLTGYSGKRGGLGFLIQIDKVSRETSVSAFGDWRAQDFTATLETGDIGLKNGLSDVATFGFEDDFPETEDDLATDLLPDGVEITPAGSKWILPKADRVAFSREDETWEVLTDNGNPAGLKLSYAESSGLFKGSFKVFWTTPSGRSKKSTAKVYGGVVDGCGYGTAVIKNLGSVPVTIGE